jgi:hypothetical protein
MPDPRVTATTRRRVIFVAYSYRLYPGPEYREVFSRVGEVAGVQFIFADTRVTNEHILDKISKMIEESEFSVFDISDWNPNVTLELGIAKGSGHPWYILINPAKSTGGIHEAPADLRGFDRVQYRSLVELGAGLERLMAQGPPSSANSTGRVTPAEEPIFDELVPVEAGKHNAVHFEATKGDTVSLLAREVDGYAFDLYLMDRRNYVQFCRDRDEHDILAAVDERIYDLRKRIPRDGTWYVVLDAYRKTAERNIALELRLRSSTVNG